ncbi:MAG: type I-C CRISPR-associated protein Cas8c/Csd1, partial [Thermomicrobiales bacterium]
MKGILAGQSGGTDLISANDNAFFSYGLENSLIAPTCASCAEKYANGLNALIAGSKTHLRVAGVEYCFWIASGKETDVVDFFDAPDPEQAKRLMDSVRAGRAASLLLDPEPFYALALSGNGARAVVLAWIDTTLGNARTRIAEYFAAQALVALDGSEGTPYRLRAIANAMVRDPAKQQPPRSATSSLLRFALTGTPLPLDLLNQAVLRCRAEQGVRRDRAALIKTVLVANGWIDSRGGRFEMLDENNKEPAYVCGRLLAVLDAIQYQAQGAVGSSVIDRFYGAASATPAKVFGLLIRNSQNHLKKMRRDNKDGAAEALGRRLEELTDLMDAKIGYPPALGLEGQGKFAIGFYHQRAEDRRRREAAIEAR